MTRREALRYTSYLTGFAISAPTISAILSGCTVDTTPEAEPYTPAFLTPEQFAFVSITAETILPKTEDMPGAEDVGVPAFIDQMLSKGYKESHQERFRNGLVAFMAEAAAAGEEAFSDRTETDRLAFLNEKDRTTRALLTQWANDPVLTDLTDVEAPKQGESEKEVDTRYDFFGNLKELVIYGYYSSQPVGMEHLVYLPVPGVYEGCIPLSETDGKSWAL